MLTNRSAPNATIVPVLVYEDVGGALEWLCTAFGFCERLRAERDGVIGHAQLTVAEGAIMIGRQGGPFRAPQGDDVSAYVHVTVDDVDRQFQRAKENGARVVQPPHDMPFGERQFTVIDPGGHRWTFSQHIADVAPQEWGATERQVRTGTDGLDSAGLHDLASRYTAAWCSQHAASVASFFSENGSLTINGATPSVGRAAITAAAQSFMTAFPDMVVEMDGVDERGTAATYRWTLTGTNRGPGGTGKSVRISGYEEWLIGADGLIAESKGFFDEAEYERQLTSGVDR
jgi:uncharacterized glyoxalase superfamily protein PhnB